VSGIVEEPPYLLLLLFVLLTMIEQAYVYILASSFQKLYIGITTEIEVRISQHKSGAYALVYLERFAMVSEAIAREKQLKKWSRIKKLRLIVAQNPTWQDLSAERGKPIQPYKQASK
jgi:putative endonuclease